MPVELIVPEVGESVTEVEIGKWLKQEGDLVNKDEPLVEIETDKVTLELPAPTSGRLGKLLKGQGDQARVGDVIGHIEAGDGADASPAPAQKNEESKAPTPATSEPATSSAEKPAKATEAGKPAIILPAAQRLIDENGLDPASIQGSGLGGRVLKEDVQRVLDARKSAPAAAKPAAPAPASASAGKPATTTGDRPEEVVPMTPLRRTIAKHLVAAQQNGALLTTFNEVDMSGVMELRARYQDAFVKKYGFKLGFMSFFVKAAIDALKAEPAVNAEIRGDSIVYKHYYDVGIAVGGGKGLVVPVVRNADRLSFAEVETTISELAKRARDNKLGLEDLQGGTFTITNGGIYGSMMSTPIINPPQSGVLGMHNIVKRPVVITNAKGQDEIAIRPMMYIALTYDHRLVDGREAVTFLKRVKDGVEDPTRLLVEV